MSYFDFTQKEPERVYHAFMFGLLTHMEKEYHIRSEREAGLGRADLLLLPKAKNKPGIILEFKLATSAQKLSAAAENALQQIHDKQYVKAFHQLDCSSILAVGIGFAGKKLATAHEVIG